MKLRQVLTITFALLAGSSYGQPGEVLSDRLSAFELGSESLGDTQRIWVQLPEGYSDTARYEVLYLLDADGHFRYMASYLDYLAKSFAALVPPTILVGVRSKSPAYRYQFFTPNFGSTGSSPQGDADKFILFLEKDLIPEIQKRYRTNQRRTLAGHSLGGLFGIYTMFKKPDLFQAVIAVSPSINYANGKLLGDVVRPALEGHRVAKNVLYFSVGSNDMRGYFDAANALSKLLGEPDRKVQYLFEEHRGTDHYSTAPEGFYAGLVYVNRK